MNNNNKFSIKNRLLSFKYAFKGLKYFFITQHNGWVHSIACILTILAGFYLNISAIEWCLIVFAIGFVFSCEILNTSIEEAVNFISPEFHKHAGLIKDIAAAGVLFSALTALVIGSIIFIPKITALF